LKLALQPHGTKNVSKRGKICGVKYFQFRTGIVLWLLLALSRFSNAT